MPLPRAPTLGSLSTMSPNQLLIAIVDDDAAVRKALGRLVSLSGARVKDYGSGEEFLAAVDGERFGCVVLDLHLPGIDGFEVMARLNARGHDLSVILVTAFDDAAARARAFELGASAFFRKPAEGQALLDAIARAAGNYGKAANRPGRYGPLVP
jgi:two-component system response regulator FixJ